MSTGGLTILVSPAPKQHHRPGSRAGAGESAMVATPNNDFRSAFLGEARRKGVAENAILSIDLDLDQPGSGFPPCSAGGSGDRSSGLNRCRSIYPLSPSSALSSLLLSQSATPGFPSQQESPAFASVPGPALPGLSTKLQSQPQSFAQDVRRHQQSPCACPSGISSIVFHRSLREAMEFHLAKARLRREKARNRTHAHVHAAIASSVGVPYTGMRTERPFLFDSDTHPLHATLAAAIGAQGGDLTMLHRRQCDARALLAPLASRNGRGAFQACYDAFVMSFCIPLVHSLAMSKNLFHSASPGASSGITYRYQAFPSIRIRQPGDDAVEPTCDTTAGHSVGCLRFHIPLTPVQATSALYTESHPGREDWHPLLTKSVGMGFLFDGARCLHFDMCHPLTPNATTAVSLDFRIAIYREGERVPLVSSNSLCSKEILEDAFSHAGPGYYDEAVIGAGFGLVAKKHGNHLLDPDHRVGPPF